jgi:hypothetical protein
MVQRRQGRRVIEPMVLYEGKLPWKEMKRGRRA